MRISAEDGYELWLRYRVVDNPDRFSQYRAAIDQVLVLDSSTTGEIVCSELRRALPALLDRSVPFSTHTSEKPALVVGTVQQLAALGISVQPEQTRDLGEEGFLIRSQPVDHHNWILITGHSEAALLYGTFHFLRLLQTQQDIRALEVASAPRIRHRILSHWDNLDGSIERGYAGRSLWKWDELPQMIDPR
ncbi:MAG TPA: alpha-glucuronidase family glycosyl hydrolase, partial [Anaerolineae bacterium]|nr:alpha-glucuronidase family glycosyl hydrolase [Anaerolineae bacterium]